MREKTEIKDIDKKGSSRPTAPLPEAGSYTDKNDFGNTAQATTGAYGEEKLVQFVVFSLGDEEFGVDIEQVSEVVRVGNFAPIPDSPEFIRGLTNVRGTIIAVINLKKRFTFRQDKAVESKHVIITREQRDPLGILVDEVTEVLRVAQKEIRPAPKMTTVIHKKYMSGVITVGERMIILLDLKSVLSEEELEKLAEMKDVTLGEKSRSLKAKLATEVVEDAGEEKAEAPKDEIKIKKKGKRKGEER